MHETMRAFHQIHMVPEDKNQQFRICCKGFPSPHCPKWQQEGHHCSTVCSQKKTLHQSRSNAGTHNIKYLYNQKFPWQNFLQYLQVFKQPRPGNCLPKAIRQCEMKKFLFRDQDFTIINVKMHEFRMWDYTASNKFWNGNLKLIELQNNSNQ